MVNGIVDYVLHFGRYFIIYNNLTMLLDVPIRNDRVGYVSTAVPQYMLKLSGVVDRVNCYLNLDRKVFLMYGSQLTKFLPKKRFFVIKRDDT